MTKKLASALQFASKRSLTVWQVEGQLAFVGANG
jgi:hypothetical protein